MAANDPNRYVVQVVSRKSKISSPELLIGDLQAGVRVASAVARVNNFVAMVEIVNISARNDDRLRTIFAAADPALKWAMNADFGCFAATGVMRTRWVVRNLSENPTGHKRSP